MDANRAWDDTALIVSTDHGFPLGEHDWWAQNMMPCYNEVAHIRCACATSSRSSPGFTIAARPGYISKRILAELVSKAADITGRAPPATVPF